MKLMGKKEAGPWPMEQKAIGRLDAARVAMGTEIEMARQRFNAKVSEIVELGRPGDAPAEAVFDGTDSFCLPDDLPTAARQAMGIAPSAESIGEDIVPESGPAEGGSGESLG